MSFFWDTLPKPFFVLAPMADVTDAAYRRLISETAPPDVMWTEFVSADGLYHTREKKMMPDEENPLVRDLLFQKHEHPIVAQFFTSNPDAMEYAARYALEQGFDGVDINMGCPDKTIEKQGAGAGAIKNPERAVEVIRAACRGTQGKIPVSVKTRLGYNSMEYETWLPKLAAEDLAAITLHLRTRKEMSKVPAHWELSPELTQVIKNVNPTIKIIGNGDVESIADAKGKIAQSGFDGIMLGRAIFGNPWLFGDRAFEDVSMKQKMEALVTLAEYFDELRPKKSFHILKKHFKAFVTGFDGASGLRADLMEIESVDELKTRLADIL